MRSRFACALLLTVAFAVSGCGSLEDIAPKAAERALPAEVTRIIEAKGMDKNAPIMMRIFKEEGVLEVWKQKRNGKYDLVKSYEICKWSGKLGPKFTEGDRQAPEGFYAVRPQQMNPYSQYHLSFNIGFPNIYDRANGRTGQHLMVHGGCSSAGCYSMTDEQVEEIYAFARDAFRGGQEAFQIQAFPFRMTPQNMARYRKDPNYEFWTMLKEGYDHFEITKAPPKVDVCERRYIFNRIAQEGYAFEPGAACPPSMQPPALTAAYNSYKKQQEMAFAQAVNAWKKRDPKPTIKGVEEAMLVADWSRRRARGERVSAEPPSLTDVAAARPAASTPAVASSSTPASAPVTAFAPAPGQSAAEPGAVTGTIPATQTEVGATPVMTGTLPVPSPNPNGTEAAAAPQPAPLPAPTRMSRLRSLFAN